MTQKLYPICEYHEDFGPVLWFSLPVQEPPYVGTTLDCDFPDHVTHWTQIPRIELPDGEVLNWPRALFTHIYDKAM